MLLCFARWPAPMHIPEHRLASWWPCPAEDYPGKDFTCFSANDFGLFLSDEDPKKGIWLEAGKALDYYMLRNGVSIYPTSFQLVPALALQLDVPIGDAAGAWRRAWVYPTSPPQLRLGDGSCRRAGGMRAACAGAATGSCALLCPQDTMEYKKKQRPLKIRMLDGTVKTVMVDDSKTVTDMLMTICARIGERRVAATGGGRKEVGRDGSIWWGVPGEQQRLCGSWPGSRDGREVCHAGEGTLHPCIAPGSVFGSDVLSSVLCAHAGITNYDEYSLVREIMEEKKEEVTGTIKKDKTLLRDEKKMEKLKQKLHTDDECRCLHVLGMSSARAEGCRAPCKGKS